jgi:hypothetical protein
MGSPKYPVISGLRIVNGPWKLSGPWGSTLRAGILSGSMGRAFTAYERQGIF